MIDIRQPNITAKTETEQLLQMRSYLYQLSQQLNWAFSTISTEVRTDSNTASSVQGKKQESNPAQTFGEIKSLIIKSADIVDAYYAEINGRLEKIYVAQSDFGEYIEKTDMNIQQNSTDISQLFTNEQTIITTINTIDSNAKTVSYKVDTLAQTSENTISRIDSLASDSEATNGRVDALEEKNTSINNRVDGIVSDAAAVSKKVDELYTQSILTSAYIKTGLLYYAQDGSAVYGLEIGQTNTVDGQTVFDKFARFSSDRLSFFDRNGAEVAYISDYKLYITNAEITGSLRIVDRFKIYYNNGLAFQWIGGE